jgi:hypothetical protein
MTLVPFKRELHVGLEGGDVRALQRALRAADCRTRLPTGEYRQVTKRNVTLFQRRHGIHQDRGVVKANTWAALQPYFDSYSAYLVKHTHIAPPASTKIDHFVKAAWAYYDSRPLRYLQERPMRNTFDLPYIDRYLDCSEFVYICAKNAGLPDPSGFGYNGYGNTYSFLDHMPRTSSPARGDLVMYDNPSHVAIAVGSVRKYGLMVLSNGSDYGPRYLQARYRTPVAYLTFKGLI